MAHKWNSFKLSLSCLWRQKKVYPFDFRGGWNDAKVDFDTLCVFVRTCAPFYRGRCVAGVVAAVALFPVDPVLLQAT